MIFCSAMVQVLFGIVLRYRSPRIVVYRFVHSDCMSCDQFIGNLTEFRLNLSVASVSNPCGFDHLLPRGSPIHCLGKAWLRSDPPLL